MTGRVLVAYGTNNGCTAKIAEAIGKRLRTRGATWTSSAPATSVPFTSVKELREVIEPLPETT